MEKNWLIRTKSFHILGPVSREKVIELVKNGSIKPEDEICSGNGYWFYLREQDLVDRFLNGSEKQGFNPITEAPVVLGLNPAQPASAQQSSEDITLLTNRPNLSALKEADSPPPSSTMAKVADRTNDVMKGRAPSEGPAAMPAKPAKREYAPTPTPVSPGKGPPRRRSSDNPRPVTVLNTNRLISDKVFMLGALVALIGLAVYFYFRKSSTADALESSVSWIVPTAHAQEDGAKKKTSSLSF